MSVKRPCVFQSYPWALLSHDSPLWDTMFIYSTSPKYVHGLWCVVYCCGLVEDSWFIPFLVTRWDTGRLFPDDIFKNTLLNDDARISITWLIVTWIIFLCKTTRISNQVRLSSLYFSQQIVLRLTMHGLSSRWHWNKNIAANFEMSYWCSGPCLGIIKI